MFTQSIITEDVDQTDSDINQRRNDNSHLINNGLPRLPVDADHKNSKDTNKSQIGDTVKSNNHVILPVDDELGFQVVVFISGVGGSEVDDVHSRIADISCQHADQDVVHEEVEFEPLPKSNEVAAVDDEEQTDTTV